MESFFNLHFTLQAIVGVCLGLSVIGYILRLRDRAKKEEIVN